MNIVARVDAVLRVYAAHLHADVFIIHRRVASPRAVAVDVREPPLPACVCVRVCVCVCVCGGPRSKTPPEIDRPGQNSTENQSPGGGGDPDKLLHCAAF